MPAIAPKRALQTTTVRLPKDLYEEARRALQSGQIEANSLNDLLVESLAEKLNQLRRELVDAGFAGMKSDERYQRESALLAEQFASNDHETLPRTHKVNQK